MEKALIIFVKNAERGKVKTRLAKSVGPDKALAIYRELLRHTREVAGAVEADRFVFYSAYIDTEDEWADSQFQKQLQRGPDLGARMNTAFTQALVEHDKAVIIGSDCPTLTPEIVTGAFRQLDGHDYVIGPATDGGYYLLGMKKPTPGLFNNMVWSTENVRSETLRRIRQMGRSYYLLPELSDIDVAEDWERYGWDF